MILVTGSTGFVGSALVRRLAIDQALGRVVAAARRKSMVWPQMVKYVEIGDILPTSDWTAALQGVNAVVHCAARVHVMQDVSGNHPLDVYHEVNVAGTLNLARQASQLGVRRFIFLSSIKVNGEFTEIDQLFTADDIPAPEDHYGVSKFEAERLLRQIAFETGMDVVIIRPPLVYGPGVKANFESMMRWLSCGLPLPLAAMTENRRSFVALDNLVDLIITCLNHPAAANQTFLVSDGEDFSTVQLLKRMAVAMGCRLHLFYVPPGLLNLGAIVLNKSGIYQRLSRSLQLDIRKTRNLLDWIPPVSVDEGLQRAAKGFCG